MQRISVKKSIYVFSWFIFISLIIFTVRQIRTAVPDRLRLTADKEETFQFRLPPGVTFESDSEEVVLGCSSRIPDGKVKIQATGGSHQIQMTLFGLIPLKKVDVSASREPLSVYPGGMPAGIYLKSSGVLVIGTSVVETADGEEQEPSLGILKTGDYIEKVNGMPIEQKENLIDAVKACNGDPLHLEVRREGKNVDLDVTPVCGADGQFMIGAWVRDDTQGIGTVTYMEEDGDFGALGHGISDSDTGLLVDISEGELFETRIKGIEKGVDGNPGVMSGVIYYGNGTRLGEVTENTDEGVFGTIQDIPSDLKGKQSVPVAYRQDVYPGPAKIISGIDGQRKEYDIEIKKINHSSQNRNKGMLIEVTDPELLELTGGIVQGMSGSPILQDGKLIGAVTHVLVNDPTKGYGIFIENMLDAAGE